MIQDTHLCRPGVKYLVDRDYNLHPPCGSTFKPLVAFPYLVHGLLGLRLPPPPYTLNLYKIFINRLKLQKSFVTHSNSCCVTPVGGNLPPDSPNFLLYVFHYEIEHSFFIFHPIFNFKMFSYVQSHYLQALLKKYFS